MKYHATLELCLRECYQAMSVEVISEGDWLHIAVGRDSSVRPVKHSIDA